MPVVALGPTEMNIDLINKWLSAAAKIAVIGGVLAAGVGVVVGVRTLHQTQEVASATLVLTLRDALENDRYADIAREIQSDPSSHPRLPDLTGPPMANAGRAD